MTLLMRDNEKIEEGKLSAFYDLVQDGDITIERAAEKAGLSVEEFVEGMKTAGYVVPEK